ncbi:MAG: hypothetical protein SGPRY_012510 [Prymnesium sp.]
MSSTSEKLTFRLPSSTAPLAPQPSRARSSNRLEGVGALGSLPTSLWRESNQLSGLSLTSHLAIPTAEAIYLASLVGDASSLEASLALIPPPAEAEEGGNGAGEGGGEGAGADGGEGNEGGGGGWSVVDVHGNTPLHLASSRGNAECLSLLLSHRAAVDAASPPSRFTPLHLAAKAGHSACLLPLLQANASPEDVSSDGSTPLHLAAGAGHTEATIVLLEGGASIDAGDATGRTALQLAAAGGWVEVVGALCDRGAQVSREDDNGWGSLHHACSGGSLDVARLLIRNGARSSASLGGVAPHQLNATIGREVEEALSEAEAEDRGKVSSPEHKQLQTGSLVALMRQPMLAYYVPNPPDTPLHYYAAAPQSGPRVLGSDGLMRRASLASSCLG